MRFRYLLGALSARAATSANVWQNTFRRAFPLAMCLALGTGLTLGAEADSPDFSAWRQLPVFYDGRMMPLNTFSRLVVESVCDRANPRLSLEGVPDSVRSLSEFSETSKMFPDEMQKFTASELLFSWIVEPKRWEHVPCLIAEHETLRAEILDLPVLSPKGKHLKYVSPYVLENSDGFQRALQNLGAKQRDTPPKNIKLTSVEAAVEQLYRAYMTYRSVSYDPFHHEPRMFMGALSAMATAWSDTAKAWVEAQDSLAIEAPAIYDEKVDELVEAVRSSLAALGENTREGYVDPREADEILSETARQASDLAALTDRGLKKVFESKCNKCRNLGSFITFAAGMALGGRTPYSTLFIVHSSL